MIHTTPPHAHNQGTFQGLKHIYYGTDDGPEDGSFDDFERLWTATPPARRERLHLLTVVGGFYGLNLLPLVRPARLTLFDLNPHQLTYAQLLFRLIADSTTAAEFLDRLATGDYAADTPELETIRSDLVLKMSGELDGARARSKRPFATSWRYALDHFDVTRRVVREAEIEWLCAGTHQAAFRERFRPQRDLWIYLSNLTLFFFFELRFDDPVNVRVLATYHDRPEFVDLDPHAGGPVELRCRLPMEVRRVSDPKGLPVDRSNGAMSV